MRRLQFMLKISITIPAKINRENDFFMKNSETKCHNRNEENSLAGIIRKVFKSNFASHKYVVQAIIYG